MESREQLKTIIGKLEKTKAEYLNAMFEHCPEFVIRALQHTTIKKGYPIIRGGNPSDTVYIILKGQARAMDFYSHGNVYTFMEYGSMDVLGDFEIFGEIPNYRITVHAVTDCEILRISDQVYLSWMEQDVKALFMRTRKLMNTLTNETTEDRMYLFMNCKERLAFYLVETYERKGNGKTMKVKKTQAELADRIGFTVRTLQRNIQNLEEEGMISTECGKIVISPKQYSGLRNYVNQYLE